jgi:hypothetical protein
MKEFTNIDGTTNYKGTKSLTGVVSLVVPYAKSAGSIPKGLGYVNKLNAAQFSHTFKGTLSRSSPAMRGTLNRGLNHGISSYNNQVSNGMGLLKVKGLAPKKD